MSLGLTVVLCMAHDGHAWTLLTLNQVLTLSEAPLVALPLYDTRRMYYKIRYKGNYILQETSVIIFKIVNGVSMPEHGHFRQTLWLSVCVGQCS